MATAGKESVMSRHLRRVAFSCVAAAVLAALFVGPMQAQSASDPAPKPSKDMKAARKAAAHRTRRIIVNNDGNDARGLKEGEQKDVEAFLARRTSPLAGSQVDTIYYCSGVFNFYTQKSDETELRGHGDQRKLDWAWELTKLGTDSLTVITDFGHKHNMEVFWSMRMNDTHDSADGALLSQWKLSHPELLMGKKEDRFRHGGGRWSAVNYGLPEVREKVFRILRDVCTRYDVDGIELDFFRHPVYFKPQMTGKPVTQEQCDQMTDLLRRVRAMTEEVAQKRGRPMLISIRVPDSLGFAKAIGLDYERWMQDDLVDILVGGGYFHFEPWENLVALGKKYDVPVYACLSASRVVSASKPGGAGDAAVWHGEAASAWKAGVNGVYLFNRFDPHDKLFRTLGSPDTLMKLDGPHRAIVGSKGAMERWLKGGSHFVTIPEQ